jgi:hypothetical protein
MCLYSIPCLPEIAKNAAVPYNTTGNTENPGLTQNIPNPTDSTTNLKLTNPNPAIPHSKNDPSITAAILLTIGSLHRNTNGGSTENIKYKKL